MDRQAKLDAIQNIGLSTVNPSAELIDIEKLINNRFKDEPLSKRQELLDYYSPCEIVMEYIGRICYNSFDAMTSESIESFLTSAANKGHRSIFEFGMLMYTAVCDIDTAEMIYDMLIDNKYIKIEYRDTEDKEDQTCFIIIKGSPRAFMEILEMFTMSGINGMPIGFFKTLYDMLSTMLPSMVSHWETITAINTLDECIPVEMTDHAVSNVKLIDITADYANPDSFTKFLVYVVCGRDVSHEIVRHRPVSYMQESQRYIRFDAKNPYVICLGSKQYDDMGDEVKDFSLKAFRKYSELLIDQRPQDARVVLPNCAKTSIFIYADKEEYRHFFRMRQSKFAYPPIKEVFDSLYYQLIDKKYI